jgi:uncharacterized membrane protein YbhN (UPF0104 family)
MTLLQRWRQQLPPLAQRALALPPPPGGLRLWITLLSFGFVLAALVSHGGQLLQLRLDLQGWLWLLLGVGLSLVSLVANGFGLGVVLRWLGLRPRWQPLLLDYLDTNLRKYLPGGIWHLTSRVQLLQDGGAPLTHPASTSHALLAVLLDPLVAAVAALALVPLGGWQAGLAFVALVPLALLWPQWLQPLLLRLEHRQAARLGLEPAAASVPVIPGYPWPPLLAQLIFVLLRFSGFACCVFAFELQESLEWTGWLAGFALAWTAGLVVPGAPGGLGVFEAVLLLRLGMAVPEAQLLAVAISYRAVVTLGDLLADGVARLDRRWLV